MGYRMSGSITIDAAYVHLFIKDAGIRKTATGEDRLLGALSGLYASSVDIVGVGINWNF
jgi:long-subunit fatty acid transport protein